MVGGPPWQLVEGKLRIVGHAAGRAKMGTDAATFDAFFRAEVRRWAAFVRETGLVEKP